MNIHFARHRAWHDTWRRVEGPTWLTLLLTYVAWGLTTWFATRLPLLLVFCAGGIIVCVYGSLQHEALHGHPTRHSKLNAWLVMLPIGLWMPYPIYRDTHLAHHACDRLTDPRADPESFYVQLEDWQRLPPWVRFPLEINNTLLGRLVIGPWIVVTRFWTREVSRVTRSPYPDLGVWLVHGMLIGVVMTWVVAVCDLPAWQYVLCFAWPGLSLTLLRSYFEHRPAADPEHRTIIVEGSWFSKLLFLNNNLHAVHHRWPGLPWYELPGRYATQRDAIIEQNGGFVIRGYGDLFKSYGLRSKDSPAYPSREG